MGFGILIMAVRLLFDCDNCLVFGFICADILACVLLIDYCVVELGKKLKKLFTFIKRSSFLSIIFERDVLNLVFPQESGPSPKYCTFIMQEVILTMMHKSY